MMGSFWLRSRIVLLGWWLRGNGMPVQVAMWLARTCGVRIRRKAWPEGAAWSMRGEHETTAHLADCLVDSDGVRQVRLRDSDGSNDVTIKSGDGLHLTVDDASAHDWEVVLDGAWWKAISPIVYGIVVGIALILIDRWLP